LGISFDFATVLTGPNLILLLHGIAVTFELAVWAWVLAFSSALVLMLVRNSGNRFAERAVIFYVELHQNIPLLVQVLFWYFAIPELLPGVLRDWLNDHDSEFILAVAALSFCFAAYMSEALRTGFRSVPRGQFEAGHVLGFGYLATMRHIVIPQALRVAAPPLVNYSLLLFKNTSIAMAIGVHELTYQSRQIESDTFRTFDIYAVTTIIYIAISFVFAGLGAVIETRYAIRQR
jgi:polar amino acid transport system permease protein